MPPSAKKRPPPKATKDYGPRIDTKGIVSGPIEAPVTESQSFRRAANAIEASSEEDPFFTQFRNDLDTDKRKLLSTIQTRQQDAIELDAAFVREMRAPIAEALRPRIPDTFAQRNAAQPKAGVNPGTTSPAAPHCPVAASGEHILQLSKQLLASYKEADKVVDSAGDGLRGAGRLGDHWPADVEKLRGLLEIGYRKAQNDVASVLRGSGGGAGDDGGGGGGNDREHSGGAGRAKADARALGADEREKAEVFFGSGRDKQEERERFNVTQSLHEAERGVARLSRSLPPDHLEE